MREDWKYSTIGESCNINYGTRVVRKRDGGTIYDVYGGGGATFKMDTYNRENCLVVSRFAMSPKCTRFVSGKFFLNDSGLTLSPKEDSELSEVFMNTILSANNDNIYEYGRGSAQRNLKVDEFCTMPISYPKSLSEQERIVALLDDQFAKIDTLKANAASQLQAAKDLFQSALKEMLTPKEGWEIGNVGSIATILHGKNQKEVEALNGKYPIYGSGGNIMGYANEYLCEEGTTILGRKGTINNPIYIAEKFWNVDTAFGICAKDGVNKRFLYYIIKSINWQEKNTGTTLPSLTQTVVLSVPISFPSLSEQERIAARLDAISEKVKALQANYDQTITLCNDLKQALLKSIFE